MLIDLLVVVAIALAAMGLEGALLRLARLVLLLRLAKPGRYGRAMDEIRAAVRRPRHELAGSFGFALVLMLVSTALLYVVERDTQPDAFGSIPRAMWWAVETLTTVGYGDAVPQTALGRMLAAVTALVGVALIALPAGIRASAFAEVMTARERRQAARRGAEHGGGPDAPH